ncbi:hypothetical protein D3C71_2111980 [compost metagenome]
MTVFLQHLDVGRVDQHLDSVRIGAAAVVIVNAILAVPFAEDVGIIAAVRI